jgi:hypothetical protein
MKSHLGLELLSLLWGENDLSDSSSGRGGKALPEDTVLVLRLVSKLRVEELVQMARLNLKQRASDFRIARRHGCAPAPW